MKKHHVIFAALLVAVLLCVAFVYGSRVLSSSASGGMHTAVLDGKTLHVEIADTDATRELGLGGHAPLAPDQGMLFVFQQDGVNKFWMKGMTFPLDIIWLTGDDNIVYIQPDLSPATYPNAYGPDTPTRYVLEVNAGYAQQNGVKVGDHLQF